MTIDKQTQKGFTLIELMIVVAIIGILASIAIPQFSAFRVKAFNSAAIADLHGINLAQEGLFTDYQSYGSTQILATDVGAAAGVVISVGTAGRLLAVTSTAGAAQFMPLTMSTNVTAISNTLAAGTAATSIAKHANGDKGYGGETDQAGVYWLTSLEGGVVTAANAAAAAAAANGNIAGVSAVAATPDLVAPWVLM
jgi:prepilin-type N-terminal cleavage/methylation domain-containing protein